MSEQRVTYLYQLRKADQLATNSCPRVFDLGAHTLEILDDQSSLLVDNATGRETMQLDHEESYRLLITLQEVFREEACCERDKR